MSDTISFERAKTHFEDRSIPRIRNMKEAYALIRAKDPKTSISFFAFRRDVIDGKIPSMKNGNRYYVNMQDVEEYYFMRGLFIGQRE